MDISIRMYLGDSFDYIQSDCLYAILVEDIPLAGPLVEAPILALLHEKVQRSVAEEPAVAVDNTALY
jgi:hypothetical protein